MITLENVRKSFPHPGEDSTIPILDIDSLKVDATSMLGVRGPSGCGKTTLLHIISGMTLPDSGTVTVAGTDITTLGEARRDRFRANHIGYIFQSFNLLDGFTALENVMLGMMFADNGSRKDHAMMLLDKVGLGNRIHHRPAHLSTGQQQRVCIARALANDPEIILADEPTGSLDPRTSQEILDLLMSVAEGRTLMVVSHEEDVLRSFQSTIDLQTINKAAIV